MSDAGPSLAEVYRARQAIAGAAIRTPLVESVALPARSRARVWLKLETTQPIGAFKIRGAVNRLAALTPAERERGVVTVSTGNHGCAVAWRRGPSECGRWCACPA